MFWGHNRLVNFYIRNVVRTWEVYIVHNIARPYAEKTIAQSGAISVIVHTFSCLGFLLFAHKFSSMWVCVSTQSDNRHNIAVRSGGFALTFTDPIQQK
jgi:hypothetical protein